MSRIKLIWERLCCFFGSHDWLQIWARVPRRICRRCDAVQQNAEGKWRRV